MGSSKRPNKYATTRGENTIINAKSNLCFLVWQILLATNLTPKFSYISNCLLIACLFYFGFSSFACINDISSFGSSATHDLTKAKLE